MNENIHVAMFHRNDGTVWLEVSEAAGQQPVVRRSLNPLTIVEAKDSLANIRKKIRAQCAIWYDRHANLSLYCVQARKWTGCTPQGTEIQLTVISRIGARWEYSWNQQRQSTTLRFNECMMCVDWVCAEGLTQEAKDFIITAVSHDVERYKETHTPDYLKKKLLVTKFLTTLPLHQDVAGEVAAALSRFGCPVVPLRATINVP